MFDMYKPMYPPCTRHWPIDTNQLEKTAWCNVFYSSNKALCFWVINPNQPCMRLIHPCPPGEIIKAKPLRNPDFPGDWINWLKLRQGELSWKMKDHERSPRAGWFTMENYRGILPFFGHLHISKKKPHGNPKNGKQKSPWNVMFSP